MNAPVRQPPAPFANRTEAQAFVTGMGRTLSELLGVVEEETRLVRDCHLGEASQLGQQKSNLARQWMLENERLKAHSQVLTNWAPVEIDTLRRAHEQFRQALQTNLTVLATAHAVSEGIVRGVASEVAARSAPKTYGANGYSVSSAARGGSPIMISRSS